MKIVPSANCVAPLQNMSKYGNGKVVNPFVAGFHSVAEPLPVGQPACPGGQLPEPAM
jgi:hypothetical protein